MKLLISLLLAASLTACGNPKELTIGGNTKEYPTYGFFNKDTEKSDKVCYELSTGNIVWSIILVETVIAPIYFIGFSLYNPISENVGGCGIDNR